MKAEIKTTLYDFFGYLIPGLVLIMLIDIISFHICGIEFDSSTIIKFAKSINIYILITLLISGYLVGHLSSAMGSFFFEKIIFKFFKIFREIISDSNLIGKEMFENVCKKFEKLFHTSYSPNNFRTLITYVESNQPLVYSTAFVFLVFYGMSRNFSILFFLFGVFEIITYLIVGNLQPLYYCITSFLLTVIFFYQYIRFFKYFRVQILNGFII